MTDGRQTAVCRAHRLSPYHGNRDTHEEHHADLAHPRLDHAAGELGAGARTDRPDHPAGRAGTGQPGAERGSGDQACRGELFARRCCLHAGHDRAPPAGGRHGGAGQAAHQPGGARDDRRAHRIEPGRRDRLHARLACRARRAAGDGGHEGRQGPPAPRASHHGGHGQPRTDEGARRRQGRGVRPSVPHPDDRASRGRAHHGQGPAQAARQRSRSGAVPVRERHRDRAEGRDRPDGHAARRALHRSARRPRCGLRHGGRGDLEPHQGGELPQARGLLQPRQPRRPPARQARQGQEAGRSGQAR